MENIHERIGAVVRDSGLTKTAFAKRVGISQAMVSMLCSGATAPSNQTIKSICREFGIQEDWLRHGLEPMRAVVSREEEISELVGRALNGSNELKKAVIRMICSRTDEELAVLDKMLRDVYDNLNKSE